MNTKKVAIIEDNEPIRVATKKFLEIEGFEILTACNGKEGLELLSNSTADLILLDLTMPVMDGREFLEAKKKVPQISNIPVIVLSALPEAELTGLGANAVIRKPYHIRALLEEVEKYT